MCGVVQINDRIDLKVYGDGEMINKMNKQMCGVMEMY